MRGRGAQITDVHESTGADGQPDIALSRPADYSTALRVSSYTSTWRSR